MFCNMCPHISWCVVSQLFKLCLQTATDNTDQYAQETKEVVRDNFYVNDILKSVENPKTAMILKNGEDMVKSDGIHLMNLIYNNRDLPMSFLEDQRRNGIKNADLISDLPTEKALDIQWKISEDSFAFNIQVNRRPLIKR